MPVALVGFALLAGLSIPYGVVHNLLIGRRERRVLDRLRSAGRFLSWAEVSEQLSHGEGTLLVEQVNKDGARFWWTPDDVASLAPAPPPTLDDTDYICHDPSHPFVAWCLERYTSPSRGSAFITRPTGISFPPGFIESQYLTAIFPRSRVVISVLVSDAA